MKIFLRFMLALVFSCASAGCLANGDGTGSGLELCTGENFVPVDACAAPICDAQRALTELEQRRQVVQGHLACSKGMDPNECAHGSQKGSSVDSYQEPDMPTIGDVQAAQRKLSALQGSYLQCCSDSNGDVSFGSTTEPDYISMTVRGQGDKLIGYISPREVELNAKVSILGCQHSQVELNIKDVSVNIQDGFSALIENIHARGNFVAQTDSTDVGMMVVAFDAHVTIKLGELGVASDTIAFVLSTEADGGGRFALDVDGTAYGRLATVSFVQGQPGGALEEHHLELNMALTIKGLQDPLL